MGRAAQIDRMNSYAARELRDTAWGRNIDALQSTVADIDRTMADQHAASMKSLDALIAAFEEVGK